MGDLKLVEMVEDYMVECERLVVSLKASEKVTVAPEKVARFQAAVAEMVGLVG